MNEPQTNFRAGWVSLGESAEYEDCIIANREGLISLREKIDQALSEGRSELPTDITDCRAILVLDLDKQPGPESRIPKWKNNLYLLGCLVTFLLLASIFFIGLGSLAKWWK